MSEIFKIKILALLHDPPWKPWGITRSIEGSGRALDDSFLKEFNVTYYERASDVHEKDGLTFAKLLGITDEEIDKYIEIVHKADRFSASLERYAISFQNTGTYKQTWKYNVFNPKHRIKLVDNIKKKCIQDYVRWIKDNLSNLNWRDKYNSLYALIEVSWYHFCPNNYPLADTRIGTYSVFDHLYATSSMVNWFLNRDLTGYIVKIDLPAIQQIISKARKAWDFWGGSYLLSWLTYETIDPLIHSYGVDIVLSPFMGLNPFFVTRLKNIPREINGKETYWEFNDLMFNPTQPIMPATVLLALPKAVNHNEDEVKKYIKELYVKAWEKIVSAVSDNFSDKSILKSLENPITPIRIRVVDVNKALRSKNFNSAFSKFMYLIKLINEADVMVKVTYGITASDFVNKYTTEKYENKELYRICTSCGVLPSVIDNDEDLEEGERLCQYCYIKRKLHKYMERKYNMQLIPSTIDIANVYNWRNVLEKKEEVSETDEYPKLLRLPDPLKAHDTPIARLFFYIYTTKKRLMLDCIEGTSEIDCKNLGLPKKEEIYYAIVKGDGDYIGKKLWKGIVRGENFKDYINTISNVTVDEKRIKEMEEEIRTIFNVNLEKDEVQIPMTPDYLITLSRGLMVVSLLDALKVSKDGFLIYSGGDDVAFLSPISNLSVLNLIEETRLNYWGASRISDLSISSSEGALGFVKIGDMIFDAPIAYGRSYGVYITHYKDPFFYSWEIASRLEELKDEVKGKDVTIILRGRGELDFKNIAIIRNSELDQIEGLYEKIKRKKELSNSFIKDVLGDEIIKKCVESDCGNLLKSVVDYYITRNKLKKDLNYTPPYNLNIIKAVEYLDDNYMG
ncbi:type III-B CRISPR-associated protein Cas10/Cmr2 [Sulfolobus sp. S-194]|uniref:type III-B CRISPR-associated protein Cas10/Cmr2 n=1 Tax=Sulfolobus sp. S-194 TaxID=2512240 RepID=UPI001436FE41|nr:type III-B CRISPR-associated protein Cas10/Cmr2 [Sulfolobus sp. S-194]QIW22851.1 type III-B CRISPR-associated protein Cas10/Cmr2 [Sulfolobus sp. S-194]